MIKRIFIYSLMALFAAMFQGCQNEEPVADYPLDNGKRYRKVGDWTKYLCFNKDRIYFNHAGDFRYTYKHPNVIVHYEATNPDGYVVPLVYLFTIDGDSLLMEDLQGNPHRYVLEEKMQKPTE